MDHDVQTQPTALLLMQICGLNRGRMHALWHDIGLHRGQPFVLRALWEHEGLTQTELGEVLHRTPATITNMLQRMEKAGFIRREPDPSDHRVSRVYLTEAGCVIQGQVQRVWQEIESHALGDFGKEERMQLHGFLLRIRDNLLSDTTTRAGDHAGKRSLE